MLMKCNFFKEIHLKSPSMGNKFQGRAISFHKDFEHDLGSFIHPILPYTSCISS